MEPMKELFAALVKATNELKNPIANQTAGEGKFSYDYVDLAAVLDSIKPTLTKNGLFITQRTFFGQDNFFTLETILGHESGQLINCIYPLAVGDPQDIGKQITYGRRYSICSLLAIAGDVDNDGKLASKSLPSNKNNVVIETNSVKNSVGAIKPLSKVEIKPPIKVPFEPTDTSFLDKIEFARYVIPIGKYKDQSLWQVPDNELIEYVENMKAFLKKKNEPPSQKLNDVFAAIEAYIASKMKFEAERGDNFL